MPIINRAILLKYHFKDEIGHELEYCQEYLDMLDALEKAEDVFEWMFFFGCGWERDEPRQKLADLGNALKKLSWLASMHKEYKHKSDCATNNMPAMSNGECDCKY